MQMMIQQILGKLKIKAILLARLINLLLAVDYLLQFTCGELIDG
jgi:hypothetical protein